MEIIQEGSNNNDLTRGLLEFLDNSPSPFHVVKNCCDKLKEAGFSKILETQSWDQVLKPGKKYFFTRADSAIIAFSIGGKIGDDINKNKPPGCLIISSHTDSPAMKLKAVSNKVGSGCVKLGVQLYGGGIWYTWFDRDLGIGGRVLVRDEDDGKVKAKLVHLKRPIMRIPTLAVHLNRAARTGFNPNKETHIVPILCKQVKKELDLENKSHPPVLIEALAKEIGCSPHDILEMDMCCSDVQPATIGGIRDEFVFGPRMDNQASCWTALNALIESTNENIESDSDIKMIVFFDHEEVGSRSVQGARSPMLMDTLKRLAFIFGHGTSASEKEELLRLRSFQVSADVIHAVHPNYPEATEKSQPAKMGEGLVLKVNAGQRYTTNDYGIYLMKALAKRHSLGMQGHGFKNDYQNGMTIGPILSATTGIRGLDIGAPIWSMHSIRETIHVNDISAAVTIYKSFFDNFREYDDDFVTAN